MDLIWGVASRYDKTITVVIQTYPMAIIETSVTVEGNQSTRGRSLSICFLLFCFSFLLGDSDGYS